MRRGGDKILPKRQFLLGGSAAFDVTADVFIPAAGGPDARIALLMQGGTGWEKYVPQYVLPWIQRGATCYDVVVPDGSGALDLDATSARLEAATGIFIGGGHTPTYRRLYATEPIRTLLYALYCQGVPVAGCSAGALIAPQICVWTRDEAENDTLESVDGLGLLDDLVVGVHFTERNGLPDLLAAMAVTRTQIGWGIDEPACAVFEDGQFVGALGYSVHEIVMTDFESERYRVTEYAATY